MTMGEYRRLTADTPDNAPLLLGFQDANGNQFVRDAVCFTKTDNWAELTKRYGWEMFGAPLAPAAILSTFNTAVPKPRKPRKSRAKPKAVAETAAA